MRQSVCVKISRKRDVPFGKPPFQLPTSSLAHLRGIEIRSRLEELMPDRLTYEANCDKKIFVKCNRHATKDVERSPKMEPS